MSDAFYSVTDRESAGRQFRLSIFMIVGMAIGAFILGFATPITRVKEATIVDDNTAFSGRLVSMIAE